MHVLFFSPSITWLENISFLFHIVSGQHARLRLSQVSEITPENCKTKNPVTEMLTTWKDFVICWVTSQTLQFWILSFGIKIPYPNMPISLYIWIKNHLKLTCICKWSGKLRFWVLLPHHTHSTFKMVNFSLIQPFLLLKIWCSLEVS